MTMKFISRNRFFPPNLTKNLASALGSAVLYSTILFILPYGNALIYLTFLSEVLIKYNIIDMDWLYR